MKTNIQKVEDKIKSMPKTSVTDKILKDIETKKLKTVVK
jgi:hypothetical protein